MHTPVAQDLSDWVEVRRLIEERTRDIEVRIGTNGAANSVTRRWQISRPSLVFSPVPLHIYEPKGGTVYCGRALSKLEQIERLARHGLPVPLTSRLTPDLSLDLARWGRYAVIKPVLGRQGEDVHLVRTESVAARYAELTQNGTREMLIQPYVEHTENGYPTEYRVMTVFGRAVYSARNSWAMPRQTTLEDIANDPNGIIASNSKQFGRARTVSNDPEIISLGERAHAAFPDIPVLGVDVVRETAGRGLFIMEVNPKGDTWHLSSLLRKTAFTDQHAQELYAQFGALDRVAQVLIEKTRAEAS
jgi:RimK-like ATP-grasp domain